jgi:hypothetical protein
MRERILKDGAIPAKYKLLMAMVTDSIAAQSVATLSAARWPIHPAGRQIS